MNAAGPGQPLELRVSECTHCHARFLPRPGPCARCGGRVLVPGRTPAVATVRAATELTVPAAGWPTPHRIALAETDDRVRVLGIVRGALPAPGQRVRVERDQDTYYLTTIESPS
ncbi:MAG: hypothetical protein L3K15_04925 [Thermoplasmata archaeon]|nr:hypothetical protein [Thermoplasmata archaeon]